jgi:hypothetical protein
MMFLAVTFVAMSVVMAAASPVARLAEGKTLPRLGGEFLTGRPVALPEAASGRVALLALGFTYDARYPVEAWSKKFRQEFERNPKVTFYEIPMIGGMARLGKWFIDSGMRRGTPPADQENVITVYGGTDPWKRRVAFQDTRAAYLILIDQNSKVAWQYAGDFDEEPYKALSSKVSRLLAGE